MILCYYSVVAVIYHVSSSSPCHMYFFSFLFFYKFFYLCLNAEGGPLKLVIVFVLVAICLSMFPSSLNFAGFIYYMQIWPNIVTREGPKAPAKEITREGKVSVAVISALSIQCVFSRPGSDEPGRPITTLNREGWHFGCSSSSLGLVGRCFWTFPVFNI